MPIESTQTDEIADYYPDLNADLIFDGHAHLENDHTFFGTRFVTLGSVANSANDDWRAKYVILKAESSGYEVIRRRVAFDYDLLVSAIKAARHHSEAFLLRFYT